MNIRLASKVMCRNISPALLIIAGVPHTVSAAPPDRVPSSDNRARAQNVTVVRMLSSAGAATAVAAAQAEALRNGSKVVIAAVDAYGNLVALLRMDGAPIVGIAAAESKARTAAQLQAPSLVLQKLVDGGKPSFLAIAGLAPLEGGMPILVEGVVVGDVGVSGVDPDSDAAIAKAAADAAGVTGGTAR